jgi:hypothetical protein
VVEDKIHSHGQEERSILSWELREYESASTGAASMNIRVSELSICHPTSMEHSTASRPGGGGLLNISSLFFEQ